MDLVLENLKLKEQLNLERQRLIETQKMLLQSELASIRNEINEYENQMNTREEYITWLKGRGIEVNDSLTDEELKNLVMDRMSKEAQTS